MCRLGLVSVRGLSLGHVPRSELSASSFASRIVKERQLRLSLSDDEL